MDEKLKKRTPTDYYPERYFFLPPQFKSQLLDHLKDFRQEKLDAFEICKKSSHERSAHETQFLCHYMQSKYELFSSIDNPEQLNKILSKMRSRVFEKGDYLIRLNARSDFLVILHEGSVSIQLKGVTIVQRKAPDLIGENALRTNEPRSADCVANATVKALLLYRSSYETALTDYYSELQDKFLQVMKQAPVVRDWNVVKAYGYSLQAKKVTYEPNSVIYTVGDPSEYVYFVLKGEVNLELHYSIQHTVMIPTSSTQYQKKARTQVVRRVV